MSPLPPPPPRPPQLRRHRTSTMALAQRLYDDGDSWTPRQIQRLLTNDGIEVSISTVRRWVIPSEAENERAKRRDRKRLRRESTIPCRSTTPVLDRMLELRAAGLSMRATGIVIRLDWGVVLTAEQVRYYLNQRREPIQPKKKAGGRSR